MALRSIGLASHIYNNNIKSVLLLMGFPALLLFMIWAFFTGLHLAGVESLGMVGRESLEPDIMGSMSEGYKSALAYGHWAIIVALIWFTISFFFHTKMMQMATGAVPVTRKEYPKIYNMLENLCISRGLQMPSFMIIDSPAMNAFASGINEKTYAITLTRGIVEALEDDELEAVIGHELSHIMNKDVRLLIISVVFVGMISLMAEMLFRMLVHRPRYGGRSSNNNKGQGAIMLIALAVLIIGYIFAIFIRFALSRKREFLADAGSVELTKNPQAMMRALLRISGHDEVSDMPSEVQQMCIENSHNFFGVFATHPPISKRVKTLSEMTGEPIPTLAVTLRRPPKRPWDNNKPPENAG